MHVEGGDEGLGVGLGRRALSHPVERALVIDEVDNLGVGHEGGQRLVDGGNTHELQLADLLATG